MQSKSVWFPVVFCLLVVGWVYTYYSRIDQGNQMSHYYMQLPRRVNEFVMSYDYKLRTRFHRLINRSASFNDPEVIGLVKDLLDPPSKHFVKPARQIVNTPQSIKVSQILKQKRGGFFVECGALDGERSSNTLFLETSLGWTGLLIEVDPYYYTQLLGKSRNAWSLNACINSGNSPSEMEFNEGSGATGSLIKTINQRQGKPKLKVPCFPLHSILLALNITHIDYFSLDVEGVEYSILKSISFTDVDISVWSIESFYNNKESRKMVELMATNGYDLSAKLSVHVKAQSLYVDDLVFVKVY